LWIARVPSKKSENPGNNNQKAGEGGDVKVWIGIPLFVLIGALCLGLYLQVAGYIRIDRGRKRGGKIYGYAMLLTGIVFGFCPLWLWLYFHV